MSNDHNNNTNPLKTRFLLSQIRILNTPILTTTPTYQESLVTLDPDADPFPLTDKVITEITNKVNTKIKSHNRLVFSTQSQRHVAEQIDALYFRDVLNSSDRFDGSRNGIWVKKRIDLCETEVIKSLPERFGDLYYNSNNGEEVEGVEESGSELSERYEELRRKLVESMQKRDEQVYKLETLRRLSRLLVPFENAKDAIQPNLVTKDGELSKELERMRVLIARVTNGLQASRMNHSGSDTAFLNESTTRTNEDKLAEVLGLG